MEYASLILENKFDTRIVLVNHLKTLLRTFEVEEDDEGERQGNGGDEPVPAKAEKI